MARTVGVVSSLCILFTVRRKHSGELEALFHAKTNSWNIRLFPKPVGSTLKTSFPLRSDSTASFCSAFKTNRKSLSSPSKSTSFIFPRESGFPVKFWTNLISACRTAVFFSVSHHSPPPFLHSLQTFRSNMVRRSRSQKIRLFCSLHRHGSDS